MNRTANGEGHRPLAGTVGVLVGTRVRKLSNETRPPRRSRVAPGGPALAGGHGAVTRAGHETRNTP
jgi:hypothetical protein